MLFMYIQNHVCMVYLVEKSTNKIRNGTGTSHKHLASISWGKTKNKICNTNLQPLVTYAMMKKKLVQCRAVLNGGKKSVVIPAFPKKPAGTPCAQPWFVAVGGWRLAVGCRWRLAVGGWRLMAVGG